jgi:hypothetical protein
MSPSRWLITDIREQPAVGMVAHAVPMGPPRCFTAAALAAQVKATRCATQHIVMPPERTSDRNDPASLHAASAAFCQVWEQSPCRRRARNERRSKVECRRTTRLSMSRDYAGSSSRMVRDLLHSKPSGVALPFERDACRAWDLRTTPEGPVGLLPVAASRQRGTESAPGSESE